MTVLWYILLYKVQMLTSINKKGILSSNLRTSLPSISFLKEKNQSVAASRLVPIFHASTPFTICV
jgi:uncharacterized membrane protein